MTANIKAIQDAKWQMPDYINDSDYKASDDLYKLAREYEEHKNQDLADSIRVIAHTLGTYFHPHDPKGPFPESLNLSRFREPEHEILEYIFNRSKNPIIRARIADVLWLRKHVIHFANAALDNYIDSVYRVLASTNDHRVLCKGYLRRIGQLAKQVKPNATMMGRIKKTFEDCINASDEEPPDLTRCMFLDEYADSGLMNDYTSWISFADKQAETAKKINNYWKAQCYLECAFNIARVAKNEGQARSFMLRVAQLHEEKYQALKASGESAMMIQHNIELAIEAYRRIEGQREKVDTLHRELIETQKNVLQEMKPIGFEVDLEKPISQLKLEISNMSTLDALVHLARVTIPPPIEKMAAAATHNLEKFPLQHIFGEATLNDHGRTVARQDGSSPSEESKNTALILEIMRIIRAHVELHGFMVNKVRAELATRFDYDETLFDPILFNHPLIPNDRLDLLRRGILSGLRGDYLTATHILVPQYENSLRLYFGQAGILITTLDNELIQKERDLNTLLYRDDIFQLFEPTVVILNRCLYTDKANFNFRNRLAHGLLSNIEFDSPVAAYIWISLLLFYYLTNKPIKFDNQDKGSGTN